MAAPPTPYALGNVDRGATDGDRTVMVSLKVDDNFYGRVRYFYRPPTADELEQRRRERRAKRKGRRRLNPAEAWRVEAKRARALCLAAVRVANSISPPTGDWRRHGEAARPYFHAMHVAAQLLCKGTCAWARARVLAHTAGDGEGLAYCTRGLRAAQAAQRPPLWWQDVGSWREAQEGLCEAGGARVCARMPGCEGVLGVGLP